MLSSEMKNNVYAPGLILTKYLNLISKKIINSIRKSNFTYSDSQMKNGT